MKSGKHQTSKQRCHLGWKVHDRAQSFVLRSYNTNELRITSTFHSLRVAKRLYYNKKLYEYKSNAKSTWKLLNDLINKKKSKCKLPSFFKSDEEEIFNPTHIANRFCEYFTNIGPDLAKSIPASDKSHRSFLDGSFSNSFFLHLASEQEVTENCSSFRSGTAPRYDCISMNVVRESFNLICAPLTYIINLSLELYPKK